MAKFYPNNNLKAVQNHGERLALMSLKALPDQFHVYHSLRWLQPRKGSSRAREGEIDIVIYHNFYGLLIIEVKGGDTYFSGGRWYYESGIPMYKDNKTPLNQAEDNAKQLRKLLVEITSLTWSRLHKLPIQSGVMLPQTNLSIAFESYLDSGGLSEARAWVEKRMSSATLQLNFQERGEVFKAIFTPQSEYLKPLSLELHEAEQSLVALSELQAQLTTEILMSVGERTATMGRAGTGKTEVALRLAITLAQRGLKTIILCYNKNLRAALSMRVMALNSPVPLLTVETVGSLAYSLAYRAGLTPPSDFDSDAVKDILMTLTEQQKIEERDEAQTYDAIIIDEGQDINPNQLLDVITLISADPIKGRLHLFYDDKQHLFKSDDQLKEMISLLELKETQPLSVNYRNPRRIAEASGALFQEVVETPDVGYEGGDIVVREGKRAHIEQRAVELIKGEGLKLYELVLLCPRGDGGSLKNQKFIEGLPLIHSKEHNSYQRWVSGEGLLVSTARSFKGLEAKYIIIYDVDDFSELYTDLDLYVSLTRAKGHAELFTKNQEVATSLRARLQVEGGL